MSRKTQEGDKQENGEVKKVYNWVIAEMRQNPFDKTNATDPKALYSWGLRPVESQWTTSSGTDYSDVLLLMKHFGVKQASELVGKSFQSQKSDASSALDYLLVQIRHEGKYTPPSYEELRHSAVVAMAKMVCPDFSNVDDETVYNAFAEAFGYGFQADNSWIQHLQTEVARLSKEKVILVDADSKEFSFTIKGPAKYMKLVCGNKTQRVVIGPYSTPISFDK